MCTYARVLRVGGLRHPWPDGAWVVRHALPIKAHRHDVVVPQRGMWEACNLPGRQLVRPQVVLVLLHHRVNEIDAVRQDDLVGLGLHLEGLIRVDAGLLDAWRSGVEAQGLGRLGAMTPGRLDTLTQGCLDALTSSAHSYRHPGWRRVDRHGDLQDRPSVIAVFCLGRQVDPSASHGSCSSQLLDPKTPRLDGSSAMAIHCFTIIDDLLDDDVQRAVHRDANQPEQRVEDGVRRLHEGPVDLRRGCSIDTSRREKQ